MERVAVHHREGVQIGFFHRDQTALAAALAVYRQPLGVSVSGKTSGVLDQLAQRLALLQFIDTLALHLSPYGDIAVVRRHDNHIVILEQDIGFVLSVDQIVVNVQIGDLPAVAINLNATQRSDVVDTSGRIDRIEHRSQRRQRVGPRHGDLARDIHLDAPYLAQRNPNLSAHDPIDFRLDALLSLLDRQTGHGDRTDAGNADAALGRNPVLHRRLGVSPYLDDHFVAGAQHVVGRRRNIIARGERQVPGGENLPAEHRRARVDGHDSEARHRIGVRAHRVSPLLRKTGTTRFRTARSITVTLRCGIGTAVRIAALPRILRLPVRVRANHFAALRLRRRRPAASFVPFGQRGIDLLLGGPHGFGPLDHGRRDLLRRQAARVQRRRENDASHEFDYPVHKHIILIFLKKGKRRTATPFLYARADRPSGRAARPAAPPTAGRSRKAS